MPSSCLSTLTQTETESETSTMRRSAAHAITILCLTNCCLASSVGAATWIATPRPSESAGIIQNYIDLSSDGDTVIVRPGHYYENLDLKGKAIALRSLAGPAETILDGSLKPEPVITCRSMESNRTIIEGFTITNGSGHTEALNTVWGGGVLCISSQPQILGNIIMQNHVESDGFGAAWGGGIFIVGPPGAEPIIIQNNVLLENNASVNGGGAWLEAPCIFANNLIKANSTTMGDGGGIYITGPEIAVIGNVFVNNRAGDHGGGIFVIEADVSIENNVMVANQSNTQIASDCSGGAIWVSGKASIISNTIAFNEASSRVGLAAGGLCIVSASGGSIISYNIVSDNVGGGIIGSESSEGIASDVPLVRNILYNNLGGDIVDSAIVRFAETETISENPLFCLATAETDGSLSSSSPALNQGFGPIGAIETPGCGPVRIFDTSWGLLKWRFTELK